MISQCSIRDLLWQRSFPKPEILQFTVEQFQLMYQRGILEDVDRYELIAGEILKMSPIGLKHAACVGRLTNNLVLKLGKRAIIWAQNPIYLGENSLPQPDITLLQYRDDFYSASFPTPADILLVIEVSDSSLEYDRDIKSKLYGMAGIPQMWLVDVNRQIIMDFRQPSALGYKQISLCTAVDRLAILACEGIELLWQEVFA